MSKIEFTTLEVANYSCIENAVIPINTAKKCLIQGEKVTEDKVNGELNSNKDRSNGTGKTSLVEAFYWCITGEFFDPGTTMATVLNRFTKEDTVVRLSGYKDNKEFIIERTLAAKSKRIGAKVVHIIKFIIDKENIHEKTSSLSQTQDTINTFLSTSPLLLLNSRIIGQGEISSFTKVNDRQKKILIDNLVGIGICDKYLSASKKLYSETCTAMTAIDIELNSLQATITRLERDKNTYSNNHMEWEDEQNKIISIATGRLAEIDKRNNTLTGTLSILKTSLEDLETQAATYSKYTDKLSVANELNVMINDLISPVQEALSKIAGERTYYTRKISDLNADLTKLTDDFTECPYCYQEIKQSHLTTLRYEIAQKIEINNKILTTLNTKNLEVEEQITIFKMLKTKINSIIEKFSSGLKTLDGLNRTMESKKNELYKLKLDKKVAEQEKDECIKTVNESRNKSESSPFLTMIANAEKEIEEIKEKVKVKLSEQMLYNEEKLYYGLISRAFDKDGIPKLISTDALNVINSLIKRYTDRIFSQKFKLELKAKPRGKSEEIYPDIDNPEGGLTYARQSGGERKNIDLCQQFALREFARMQDKSNFNVEFFDEVFAELDNYTSELFLDLIFEGDTDNIFIITHKDMCKEYFKNRVTVKKNGNTSTVHVNYASVNEPLSETLEVEK